MEFGLNYNSSQEISLLKKDFALYPIELQLVWLSEILLILAFANAHNKERLKLNKESDKYVLTQHSACSMLAPLFGGERALVAVNTFRNKYVHKGSLAALPKYRYLLTIRSFVDKLAEFAGVTLNWNCSLYKILDVKDV